MTTQQDDAGHVAISRLQHAYGDVCTRRAWAEMRELALPGARFSWTLVGGAQVDIVGPDAVGAFGAKALALFDFYHYTPGVSAVDLRPEGTAAGRFHVTETGRLADGGQWQDLYGVYHDEYVRQSDRWFFASRRYELLAVRTGGDASGQT